MSKPEYFLTTPGLVLLTMLLLAGPGLPGTARAQRDTIDPVNGRSLRGTIQSSSPAGLVIETSDGSREVAGWQIRRVKFGDEPNELTRARSAYADDRYNVTLQELASLTTPPDRELIQSDIRFFQAMAAANTALAGGGITAAQASDQVRQFINECPNSYMLEAARAALSELTFAQGDFPKAVQMFATLASSDWPEIQFQSLINQGQALMMEDKHAEAIKVFEQVDQVDNAADYALQGKAIARCLRAQALAFAGKPDEARQIALDIIRNTDARNSILFGHAYNALGASHLEKGELKDAARAYLHTDLLFTTDPDAHAQALYQLTRIWPQLERSDRAVEARQKIRDRYRNTFWPSTLDDN